MVTKKKTEYERCWACDTLVYVNGFRLEYHHPLGRTVDKTIPLCVICHDIVDRFNLNDMEVGLEYLKGTQELEELPRVNTNILGFYI